MALYRPPDCAAFGENLSGRTGQIQALEELSRGSLYKNIFATPQKAYQAKITEYL